MSASEVADDGPDSTASQSARRRLPAGARDAGGPGGARQLAVPSRAPGGEWENTATSVGLATTTIADPAARWRRLSMRAMVVRPLTDLIRLLPLLAGLLILHARTGTDLVLGIAAAVLAVANGLVHWATTRYLVTGERVYLRRGLFNTKTLSVARDRIRAVDVSAHLLHRVLGVCRVSIGTGRNDLRSSENFHLDGLTRSDAESLRALLIGQAGWAPAGQERAAVQTQTGLAPAGQERAGESQAGLARAGGEWAGESQAGLAQAGLAQAGLARAGQERAGESQAGLAQAGLVQPGLAQAGLAPAGQERAAVQTQAGLAQAGLAAAGQVRAGESRAGESRAGLARAGGEIVRFRIGWLRFAPLTAAGLVVLGVLFGAVSQIVHATDVNLAAIGPVRRITGDFDALPFGQRVLALLAVAIAGYIVVAVAGYIAVYWNFRLTRDGADTLRITRGLLSVRATTISLPRLRGVEISEPLSLRAVGGARCAAITTGLRVGRGAEREGSVLVPPAPLRLVVGVAAEVLGVPAEICSGPLEQHGPAARRRRYTRGLGGTAVLVAGVVVASRVGHWPAWAPISLVAAFPLAGLIAADRYRGLGHRLTGGWLVTRVGSLARRRSVLGTDAIIGWRIHQTWFQRRQGLMTLTATTAAGQQHYSVRDVPVARGLEVATTATPDLIRPFLAPEAKPSLRDHEESGAAFPS